MEYIDGTDASELVRADGPLDPDLAVQLVSAAAAALDYAWRKQRVTHRDVKPANILVGIDESGGGPPQIESVKLADFGIAKAAGESTSLTSTGMTIGTMQYISPEAIEGEVVDNRSDIYSLGCTAFHSLAGQPPFTGTSMASTMSVHLTRAVPSISAINPRLPKAMDAVFELVLAKNPDDRYQSCAEFVAALQEAAGGEVRYPASARTLGAATLPNSGAVEPDAPTLMRKGEAKAASRPKSRTVPIIVASVAALAMAGTVLGVYATRGGNDEPAAPAVSTTLTTTTAPVTTPSVAPPPVVTTTAETSTSVPTEIRTEVTTTAPAAPAPYEGIPCTAAEYGNVAADGTLVCSALTGAWRDLTHQSRPAVQLGTMCTEPGARARVAQTEGIATCTAGPNGDLVWSW